MVALRTPDAGDFDRAVARPKRPQLRIVRGSALPALVRHDALPEHTEYRDNGCELAASCLACPLPRCKYDEAVCSRKLAAGPRDREIVLLRRKYAAPITLLASTYGLSRRTIFRILAEAKEQAHA